MLERYRFLTTFAARENSEVSPVVSLVAVALMYPLNLRAFIPKEASLLASVLTLSSRTKRCPSPKPEGSGAEFRKSWMVKVVLGVELSVPLTMEHPVSGRL